MNTVASNADAALVADRASPEPVEEFALMLKRYSSQVRRDRRLSGTAVLSTKVHSPRLCGSQLTMDALIDAGRIQALGYRVRACSLGQAMTAIVAERSIGMNASELRVAHKQLVQILSGQAPDEHALVWPELAIFQHAAAMPSRHGSAMLPFLALDELFQKLPTSGYSNSEELANKETEHG